MEHIGKRGIDFVISLIGLVVLSPILGISCILIWCNDFRNPIYFAKRVGKKGASFNMYKLRSMRVNADLTGVSSTSVDDNRITGIGKIVRRFKLDELMQLGNVFIGNMSLVGPRPNTIVAVYGYSIDERKLISIKPGITDFSSIVFSDEGEILKGHLDPDMAYEELIRPGKSMLGLFYIDNQSMILDMQLVVATIVSIFSRKKALRYLVSILRKLNANNLLIRVASRQEPLRAIYDSIESR
jgi:lipopolysaccharide/colanic/teichoic acid biosynthesis glycosyltransferase